MFEKFNLRDNAFPVTPIDQDGTPWFGFNPLKQEFETIFEQSKSEQLRLCVLNRGRLGAGKTHAARFFAEKFAEQQPFGNYHRCVSIVIESPKQPPKAFNDFTGRLFNGVTFRRIVAAARNLRSLSNVDVVYAKLLAATGSEDTATVLSRIDDGNLLSSKAFLLGGGTAKELRELGVAKRLTYHDQNSENHHSHDHEQDGAVLVQEDVHAALNVHAQCTSNRLVWVHGCEGRRRPRQGPLLPGTLLLILPFVHSPP